MSKISVRVPATSANIGPGFDTLGIAFSLYNIFSFEETDSGLRFSGCDNKYRNENNLCYVAFKLVADAAGKKTGGLSISFSTEVPVARGLGSSATLIAGGAMGANELLSCGFSKRELLKICLPLEGHADNLTPAFLGGFTAAMTDKDNIFISELDISDKLRFFALIPDFETKTANARAVLPKEIPYKDAVSNISHIPLLIKALKEGDGTILPYALGDRLHEPYRQKLIYNFDAAKKAALDSGACAFFISGSGSTCISVATDDIKEKLEKSISSIPHSWKVIPLKVDREGACILK